LYGVAGGHKDEGVACGKKLEKFTKEALWVSGKKYNFPKEVECALLLILRNTTGVVKRLHVRVTIP